MQKKTVHHHSKWSRPKKGWNNNSVHPISHSSSRVKLAILVLVIICLVILLGKVVYLIASLQQPVFTASPVNRHFVWHEDSNLNLLVKADKISLVSFNPTDKTAVVLTLPDNLYLNLPKGLGNWQLGSIYSLGQSNPGQNGGELMRDGVANLLGVPVEGYVVFNGNLAQKSASQLLESLRDGVWNGFAMSSQINSDLTPTELFKLNLGLRGVRFDKIEYLNLTDLSVLDSQQLPDGTPIQVADTGKIDDVAEHFVEPAIVSEKLSVSIFNSTDHAGLAQKASRIISNLGGNVIFSTNTSSNSLKTKIYLKADTNLQTPQLFGQIFASACSNNLKCDIIVCTEANSATNSNCQVDPEVLQSRAQVNVILGEDFSNRF